MPRENFKFGVRLRFPIVARDKNEFETESDYIFVLFAHHPIHGKIKPPVFRLFHLRTLLKSVENMGNIVADYNSASSPPMNAVPMPDTIEQLEEKKRRLELEVAIASLERKKETDRVISKTPTILFKVLYWLAVLSAIIGSTMFFLGIAYELDGLRSPKDWLIGALLCAPLVGLLLWRNARR